jgi:hypothetical protein
VDSLLKHKSKRDVIGDIYFDTEESRLEASKIINDHFNNDIEIRFIEGHPLNIEKLLESIKYLKTLNKEKFTKFLPIKELLALSTRHEVLCFTNFNCEIVKDTKLITLSHEMVHGLIEGKIPNNLTLKQEKELFFSQRKMMVRKALESLNKDKITNSWLKALDI